MPRIPEKNNKGEKRGPMTAKRVMANDAYYFKACHVKKMKLNFNYEAFIEEYLEVMRQATRRMIPPSKKELEAFNQFDVGKITLRDFGNALGIPNTSGIQAKLGRLYAYAKTTKL